MLLSVSFCVSCAAFRGQLPEQRLRYFLAMPQEGGDVFAQGELDGVDYRTLLRGAVAKDAAALSGIFRYTAHGKLMGEGAETNGEILYQLLHTWGDASYARILRAESREVRTAVIAELDYEWLYPGWRSHEFPITYRLAEHHAGYRR